MDQKEREPVLKEMAQMRDSAFLKMLKHRLDKCKKELTESSDDIGTRWLQGRAQELSGLISDIESARSELEKKPKTPIQNAKYF